MVPPPLPLTVVKTQRRAVVESATDVAVASIKYAERKIIRRARQIIERGVLDATCIDDDGTDGGVEVFTDSRRKRVAMDLRKAARDKKAYLEFALRRVEGAEKVDAAREAPRVELNGCTVINVQAVVYPEMELDQERK